MRRLISSSESRKMKIGKVVKMMKVVVLGKWHYEGEVIGNGMVGRSGDISSSNMAICNYLTINRN